MRDRSATSMSSSTMDALPISSSLARQTASGRQANGLMWPTVLPLRVAAALIIPNPSVRNRIGSRVLVAWNGKRGRAAVFDALPILKHAPETKVVWIDPQADGDTEQDCGQHIREALLRHGVKCDKTRRVTSQAGVGPTLMAKAEAFDADMLVMGCYGHSRLREFVFGGATRYALEKMGIPVLMWH